MKKGYMPYASTEFLVDLPKNIVDKESVMPFILRRLKHNIQDNFTNCMLSLSPPPLSSTAFFLPILLLSFSFFLLLGWF
jgi:hypothetical protein